MIVDVVEDPTADLAAYARVPIAYEVREIVDVADPAGSMPALVTRSLETPYTKDYDAHGGPETWASRFDLAYWRFFAARIGQRRVGGAVVILRAPDVDMLDGDSDAALLWDIRVAPEARGLGVGTALVSAVESWALARGARRLDVETQNVNVPACRFYAARGFRLRAVNPRAYPALPNESQLLWRKELRRGESGQNSSII